MNFFEPIGHVPAKNRPGDQFEQHPRRDQWILLVDGIRVSSSMYMRRETAENAFKDRLLIGAAKMGPMPANWRIIPTGAVQPAPGWEGHYNQEYAIPMGCLVKMRETGELKVIEIWEFESTPVERMIENIFFNIESPYDILIVGKP